MSLEQLHALPLLGGEGRTEPQHQGAISFFFKNTDSRENRDKICWTEQILQVYTSDAPSPQMTQRAALRFC